MQRLAVTRELAWKIKQMYAETDELGRRKWTQAKLAQHFRVSETTVFRAVNNLGPYGIEPLPEAPSDPQLAADAAESLERFKQRFPQHMPQPAESATERMAREAAAIKEKDKAGDKLTDELIKGDSNG